MIIKKIWIQYQYKFWLGCDMYKKQQQYIAKDCEECLDQV